MGIGIDLFRVFDSPFVCFAHFSSKLPKFPIVPFLLQNKIKHLTRFFELKQSHDDHTAQSKIGVLKEANVVGMTTTGVAINVDLVEALGAKIIVIEEAAEV